MFVGIRALHLSYMRQPHSFPTVRTILIMTTYRHTSLNKGYHAVMGQLDCTKAKSEKAVEILGFALMLIQNFLLTPKCGNSHVARLQAAPSGLRYI